MMAYEDDRPQSLLCHCYNVFFSYFHAYFYQTEYDIPRKGLMAPYDYFCRYMPSRLDRFVPDLTCHQYDICRMY